MPAAGVARGRHEEFLRHEETARLFPALGARKLRLTGGEPLVRKGLTELAAMLHATPGIEDLSLSTNGHLPEVYRAASVECPPPGRYNFFPFARGSGGIPGGREFSPAATVNNAVRASRARPTVTSSWHSENKQPRVCMTRPTSTTPAASGSWWI